MSAGFLRCFAFAVVLVVLLAPRQARADDPTDLEGITVVGTALTEEGFTLYCFSTACNQILPLSTAAFDGMFSEISEVGGPVDKDKFCQNLKGNQPPGCSYSNPPSVPGFDPSWTGNGCGDGSIAVLLVESVVGHVIWGYEGDLDHPFPGVSFYPSCQAHDRCYASSGSKGDCDSAFLNNLSVTCSMASATYQTSCSVMAGLFYEALQLGAWDNYAAAQAELACAAWGAEMEVNECAPPR